MSDWRDDIERAVSDFTEVATLAGDPITAEELEIVYLPAPHRPPSCIPVGKRAIYGFYQGGRWLKIGQAGPNSQPRYCSQHYTGGAGSTLSRSLISDLTMTTIPRSDSNALGEWIKKETNRVNILLSIDRKRELLSLLESFLHVRLKPLYEG